MVKTKIIATLGPASETEAVLRKMVLYGLDVVRLNFSHGSPASHRRRIQIVRKLNKKMRRHIKIMQDLEGHRIRIGKLAKKEKVLKKKNIVYLAEGDFGSGEIIPFDYRGSLKAITAGSLIFIDDGRIILKAKKVFASKIKAEVIRGGVVKENKGINIPQARLRFPALSEKDKKDLAFGIKEGVDFIAQSFVRSEKDILVLKDIVSAHNPEIKIFAKIENQQALKNIEKIIKVSDGIIVARGDLGVCVPIYKIPIVQKGLVRLCLKKNKPVVVATQMLESMVSDSIPTRAEVTDVANAILDGANYLMLSAETAIGRDPAEALKMMNDIIKYTENSPIYKFKQANLLENV